MKGVVREGLCSAVCPELSRRSAACYIVGYMSVFVLVLYLPWCRGNRDRREVIVARIATTAVVSVCSMLTFVWFEGVQCLACYTGVHELLHSTKAVAIAVVLTSCPYLSDLAIHIVDRVSLSERIDDLRPVQLRNYMVAPILEEIVFRAGCCSAWSCTYNSSEIYAAVIPALVFAAAHTHHAIQLLKEAHNRTQALLSAGLQFTYTLIFGTYAGWIYLRLRSLPAAIIAHILCNIMGLPDIYTALHHRHKLPLLTLFTMGLIIFAAAQPFL